MRDDLEFNARFVQRIETHPCLYDFTLLEYSRRDVVEAAWEAIGAEMCSTVAECKFRWKNIRTVYARHLKAAPSESSPRGMRQYYLAPYLKFVYPFLKTRPAYSSPVNVKREDFDSGEDIKVEHAEDENRRRYKEECVGNDLDPTPHYEYYAFTDSQQSGSSTTANSQPAKRSLEVDEDSTTTDDATASKRTPSDGVSSILEKGLVEFLQSKREDDAESTKPDMLFLRSLLPDIERMTPKEKRWFKVRVVQLIDDIVSSG